MQPVKESAQKVQAKLKELGYANQVVELPDSTRTAAEAAAAIGCEVAQIAKSIIFRLPSSDKPLLVVASGENRVDEKQLAKLVGEKPGKADADFVREKTGFVIGGVAPVGHREPIETWIDEDLFRYEVIWAAAGHPKAVFRLTPEQLVQMTNGQVACIASCR
ncbi:YbaK/EbsC family protein [Brevibacillus agri]|uniref:YbaK/EbsC family protein n=1 Tax=Brevibacillus agri TaxID=51101 RepID=UPI0024BF5B6E|nr:YbaK/EbsC family protein [Brevibacillus agri]MDR9503291.1 YbaK/EbsC family protein [Brevibacillus agri]MED4571290.1 YbaK/EbsC family protein [Brevibacillus agri]WHX29048.1 YbaK/EbsC family protein [Brevibacillus agri]